MTANFPEPDLHSRLLAWIGDEHSGFASFAAAAAAVFHHQYQNNAPYRRYWDSLGIPAPHEDFDWQSAPALPADCFKETALPPRSFDATKTRHTFLTSGTSKDIRGRHEFATLDLYESSIREGWKQLGLPAISNPWFLAPPARSTPESSLGHMFATLGAGFDNRWLLDESGVPGFSPLTCRLTAAGETPEPRGPGVSPAASLPINLFSTSIALFRLMETHNPILLPPGSWIFETGGPKGLSITLDPAEFHNHIAVFFSIPRDRVLNEYSMTELSSQFYRWSSETSHRGPHWTRIRVIDPETNRPATDGQPGYLEIIDLANLGSVAAIRTQDLAIATGENTFQLFGRDPTALPRGCSRAADDLWQRPPRTNSFGPLAR